MPKFNFLKQTTRSLVLATTIAMATSSVSAQSALGASDDSISSGEMAADLLIVRPLSFVGTILGTAGFFISLPFTIPAGSVEETGRTWVGAPFEYTFSRPLGDFNNCGLDKHPCSGRTD